MPRTKAHVLIVEDEAPLQELLRYNLTSEGYTVSSARSGDEAELLITEEQPDLVILDWMLPGMDGLEVCRRIRAAGSTPVLMLTAKDAIADRVQGLDAGADDYVVKPFSFDELVARVRALLRRAKPASDEAGETLKVADLVMNTGTREVWRGSRKIDLTAKEFDLLELFMRNPRQVLTREMIYDRIWGYDFGGESNIIEVYVRYLRQKLESENESRLLQTVRGYGYALREE
jgi:two-component system response regulator MprA